MILTARCDGCYYKFPFTQLTEGALRFCPECALERGPKPWPDDPAAHDEETAIMSRHQALALARSGGDATHDEITVDADIQAALRSDDETMEEREQREELDPQRRLGGPIAAMVVAASLLGAILAGHAFQRCTTNSHSVEAPAR